MSATPYPSHVELVEFIRLFGCIYERSPWVAKAIYPQVTPGMDALSMASLMETIVDAASEQQKLDLLRAHPDLAGRLSLADLTESSRTEQTRAGLHQCSPDELKAFKQLNSVYRKKFGFPFIFAVKGFGRKDILEAFQSRSLHSYEEEFDLALEQVHRIARLRLETVANET